MTDSATIERLGREVISVCSDSWRHAFGLVKMTYTDPDYDSRSKSVNLQMEAVRFAKKILIPQFGAKYHTRHSQHIFVFPEKAVVVFKQLNSNLLPCAGKTPHARSFYSQEPLPGLEPSPRLICGGVTDENWLDLTGVFLTHPKRMGRAYNWALNITSEPIPVDADQSKINLPDPQVESTPRPNPFTPKYGKKHDADDGESAAGVPG